jgi:hypothetical protein
MLRSLAARAVAAPACLWVAVAIAQTSTSAEPPPPVPATAKPEVGSCCRLAAGTAVEVELTETVSSKTAAEGSRFGIRLARDLQVDGQTVLLAGAVGYGEVIDAAAGGIAGRPGKLVLVARSLDAGAVHVPLRGFHLGASGRDSSKLAIGLTATPYVGILALAIPGGNVEYAAGTRVNAKVAADVSISPLGAPTPPPGPTTPADSTASPSPQSSPTPAAATTTPDRGTP